MLRTLGRIAMFIVGISTICNAQITELDYYMEYDTSTCWYDFYIVIVSGSNTTTTQSFQLNSQYSLVVQHSSTRAITQLHQPLQLNGQPCVWNIGTTHSYPIISPVIDFISIFPNTNSLSKYSPLMPNDTVKLFSMNIDPPSLSDNKLIRIYKNNVDPSQNDPDMFGQSFKNTFTIGVSGASQYRANKEPVRASNSLSYVIDTSNNNLFIDITTDAAPCQLPITYQWYGPNNYNSNSEDLLITPYTSNEKGIYTVIATDILGNLDTTILEVGNNSMNYVLSQGLQLTINRTSAGVLLPIFGDQNRNSELLIEYRESGLQAFQKAITSTRANPDQIVDGNPLGMNYHAGSLFSLGPNTKYDLRVSLIDPDGYNKVIDTTFTTPILDRTTYPEIFYVTPGTSGGSGSAADPFKGMQTALDNSYTAGKTLLAYDGVYTPFIVYQSGSEESATTIKSINLHGAIIDGSNTSTGIVTIGNSTNITHHVILDGFLIQNGNWGIDAQNTQDLIIRNNQIIDVDYGIVNRKENGWESNQFIYNNLLEGRTVWPQTNGNIPSERGIDIRGNKNVIHNNTISNFGDGVSTDGPLYGTSHNLEIHHNDITRIVDDLIEVDGTISNTLIYRNRLMNGRVGVSLAPILGGPAYVFRNEIINTEYSAFKLNRSTSGIQIYQNTILNSGYAIRSPSGWQSVYFKNNAVISEGYCYEEFQNVAGGLYKYKNNAYKSARNGTSAQPWFKWNNTRYHTLNDLKTSTTQDSNSIAVDFYDFEAVTIPVSFDQEVLVSDNDLYPSVSSQLLNVGEILNSINAPFVTDSLPDIGALEYGEPYPTYGADFSNVCSYNDLSQMTWNGSKSNAWFDDANWTPCGVPNKNSDVYIVGNTLFYPFLNTETTVKSLSLSVDATFVNCGNVFITP